MWRMQRKEHVISIMDGSAYINTNKCIVECYCGHRGVLNKVDHDNRVYGWTCDSCGITEQYQHHMPYVAKYPLWSPEQYEKKIAELEVLVELERRQC
jgi:hypothetical protein